MVLQADGGDVSLVTIEDGTVQIRLKGNCLACTVNQMTLKSGIEMTIKKYAPQIKKVLKVEDEKIIGRT